MRSQGPWTIPVLDTEPSARRSSRPSNCSDWSEEPEVVRRLRPSERKKFRENYCREADVDLFEEAMQVTKIWMTFSVAAIAVIAATTLLGRSVDALGEPVIAQAVEKQEGSVWTEEMLAEHGIHRVIKDVGDAIGAYALMGSDATPVRVEEFVWGITSDGDLGFAVFRGVDDDGQVYFFDKPELYERLAFSTEELSGAYTRNRVTGKRTRLESIEYCVDQQNIIRPLSMRGWTSAGEYFKSTNFFTTCCQWGTASTTECLSSTCSGQCPGTGACDCTGTTGSCYLLTTTGDSCVGACGVDGCPGQTGHKCKGSGGQCSCQA